MDTKAVSHSFVLSKTKFRLPPLLMCTTGGKRETPAPSLPPGSAEWKPPSKEIFKPFLGMGQPHRVSRVFAAARVGEDSTRWFPIFFVHWQKLQTHFYVIFCIWTFYFISCSGYGDITWECANIKIFSLIKICFEGKCTWVFRRSIQYSHFNECGCETSLWRRP